MEVVTIKKRNLHHLIRYSPVFIQLYEEDESILEEDECIGISKKYFFENFDNLDDNKFMELIESFRFWNITNFPDEIMNFAYYQICNIAANNDYYDLLEYAHKYGCPWNEDTTANAAAEGNLYCLIFLHENGCPWDERTCALSMANGHFSCLHYAQQNGAPQ